MKKTTIYDVAEEAGVSLATVSRVINGSNVVKPATRERVLDAIKKLDFKPNQIARGLATSKTTSIAIVFPESLFAHVKDMIGGIGDTARTLDYNISIYTTEEIGDGNPVNSVLEKVIKSRADGVVLFNSDNVDNEIEMMKKYNVPTVVIGYEVEDDNLCSISVDAKSISKEITNDYLDRGIDDIIFVKPRQNLVRLDEFADGIKEAFAAHGLTFGDDRIISTSTHYEKSYPFFQNYFKDHRHQLVLNGYDKEAVAVVNGAQDNGIAIPDDMEVIGMMNTSYSIMSRPALTTIHVPVYELGAMAIRLLTKMLNGEEITEHKVIVSTHLIKRNSTK